MPQIQLHLPWLLQPDQGPLGAAHSLATGVPGAPGTLTVLGQAVPWCHTIPVKGPTQGVAWNRWDLPFDMGYEEVGWFFPSLQVTDGFGAKESELKGEFGVQGVAVTGWHRKALSNAAAGAVLLKGGESCPWELDITLEFLPTPSSIALPGTSSLQKLSLCSASIAGKWKFGGLCFHCSVQQIFNKRICVKKLRSHHKSPKHEEPRLSSGAGVGPGKFLTS